MKTFFTYFFGIIGTLAIIIQLNAYYWRFINNEFTVSSGEPLLDLAATIGYNFFLLCGIVFILLALKLKRVKTTSK
jgi:hypothetical protein